MKAKKILLLGTICFLLVGCNSEKPLEMKGVEMSIEGQDTQREDPAGEEGRSGLAEGQDTQREDPAGEEGRSGLAEGQDTRREDPAGEEGRSNPVQGTGGIGAGIEGCYDDPNNPAKDQNYDVGQPIYE